MTLEIKNIELQDNIRTKYDKKSIKELSQSIKEFGLLQPVGVTKVKENGKQKHKLVFGFRRFLAYELLSESDKAFNSIPVTFVEDENLVQMQLIENIQREDMNPMDEAEAFLALSKEGMTNKEIGLKIGKSDYYVVTRLQLNKLIAPFKALVRQAKVTLILAVELSKCPEDMQKEFNEDAKDNLQLFCETNPQEIRVVLKRSMHNLTQVPFDKEKKFDKICSCTECPNRTGFNKTLFQDIAKDDQCLDENCFQMKMSNHLKTVYDKVKAEGNQIIVISNSYWVSGELRTYLPLLEGQKEIYSKNDYVTSKEIKKEQRPDKDPYLGIIIDQDENLGKIVKVYLIKDLLTPKNEKKNATTEVEAKATQTPDQRYNRKIVLISKPERTELLERSLKEFKLTIFKADLFEKIPFFMEFIWMIAMVLFEKSPWTLRDKFGISKFPKDLNCHSLAEFAVKCALVTHYESGDERQFCLNNNDILNFIKLNIDVEKIYKEIKPPYDSDRAKVLSKFKEKNKREPKKTEKDGYVNVGLPWEEIKKV